MDILVIQPGFPKDIPKYVRGLAQMGARVLGVGDQAPGLLPPIARYALYDYLQVPNLWDAQAVIKALSNWKLPIKLDRIECLWEPAIELTAQIRQAFGLPGMSPEQAKHFRDKDLMRKLLGRAGIRNPRHARVRSRGDIWQAVQQIGYPLVIKPVAGAGCADTYRVDSDEEMQALLPRLSGMREGVVEEFVEGHEFTFDTICANGEILFYNVAWYRPTNLIARSNPGINLQAMALRDPDAHHLRKGVALGKAVLRALKFQTGFTHMEWFLKPDGDAVFGEIAARPPGGRLVEVMSYTCDYDMYHAWAQAIVRGYFTEKPVKKYNAAVICKRAQGRGRVKTVEGWKEFQQLLGPYLLEYELPELGTPITDWRQSVLADGFMMIRHPNLETAIRMADLASHNVVIRGEVP